MTKRQVFTDMRVPVCSIMLNGIPAASHTHLTQDLKERFARVGLPFAGAIPSDALLAAIRLDEVQAALGADMLYGDPLLLDQEYNSVIVASQRLEELLEQLAGEEAVTAMQAICWLLLVMSADCCPVKGPVLDFVQACIEAV